MCPLLAETIDRAVRDRDLLRSPIDLALFGAAADAAEEDGDADLAHGLRSGRCPDNWGGGEYWWSQESAYADRPNDLDNVPDTVFDRLPGATQSGRSRVTSPTWQDAFRALGRAMREDAREDAWAAPLVAEIRAAYLPAVVT